jgi:hypothetical protein
VIVQPPKFMSADLQLVDETGADSAASAKMLDRWRVGHKPLAGNPQRICRGLDPGRSADVSVCSTGGAPQIRKGHVQDAGVPLEPVDRRADSPLMPRHFVSSDRWVARRRGKQVR